MVEFKEIGRIKISASSDIVLSSVVDSEGRLAGYSISKFVTTDKYTGFTKSILISADRLHEFLALFPTEKLEESLRLKGRDG